MHLPCLRRILRVARHGRRTFLDPLAQPCQLPASFHTRELQWLNAHGFLRPRGLLLPYEVHEVLRRVEELGTLRLQLRVEDNGLLVRKHAGVDANAGILDAVDQPINPVFGSVRCSCLNEVPVVVELPLRLQPVPGVGDEVRRSLGNYGDACRARETAYV